MEQLGKRITATEGILYLMTRSALANKRIPHGLGRNSFNQCGQFECFGYILRKTQSTKISKPNPASRYDLVHTLNVGTIRDNVNFVHSYAANRKSLSEAFSKHYHPVGRAGKIQFQHTHNAHFPACLRLPRRHHLFEG